ncbi:MAG: UDP-2,3-diacylglucosamine diphosphatase [Rhodothermales bacterium]
MILFISDVHLGRGDVDTGRAVERDLISCLSHHRNEVEHLYILGDLFDEYIEYRRLVPKGFVRLQGLLADWTDTGIPVTYLVGNHDPWHIDYFEAELGVRIAHDVVACRHHGVSFHLAHGDAMGDASTFKGWLKGWLRHPVPVWLYRSLLPADLGLGLARAVNRTFGNREIDRDLAGRLRVKARRILEDHTVDVVILGHSHQPECTSWPEGGYLNPGYWHESRSFARLVDGATQLVRWNGRSVDVVQDYLRPVDSS